MCPPGPVFGLLVSTDAHAVPVCVGATGLGLGAAEAEAADSTSMTIAMTTVAAFFMVPPGAQALRGSTPLRNVLPLCRTVKISATVVTVSAELPTMGDGWSAEVSGG
jgi:hypothetical protein